MVFERKHQPLLPIKSFIHRQLIYAGVSVLIILLSVGIGTAGYSCFGDLDLIDGFYNACMILTGMGPVDVMKTNAGKLFASFYALFSGVIFLSTVAVLFAPLVHRLLHMMHIEDDTAA